MFRRIFFSSIALTVPALFVIACDGVTSTKEKPAEPAIPKPVAAPASGGGDEVPAVLEVTRGAEIKLAEHVVKGQYTIFDFYSDGCPPCRLLKPRIEKLVARNREIVLRVVNVNRPGAGGIDWASPVIKQYAIGSLPHLKVYDKEGKLMLEGDVARQWFEDEYEKLDPSN